MTSGALVLLYVGARKTRELEAWYVGMGQMEPGSEAITGSWNHLDLWREADKKSWLHPCSAIKV